MSESNAEQIEPAQEAILDIKDPSESSEEIVNDTNTETLIVEEKAIEEPLKDTLNNQVPSNEISNDVSLQPVKTDGAQEVTDDAQENILTTSLTRFAPLVNIDSNEVFAEEELTQVNSLSVEIFTTEEGEFAAVIFSDDTIHPEPLSVRLLSSPKPPRNHDFVNVDYNADPDEFNLDMGLVMSRSGSVQEFYTDPEHLLFGALDTDRKLPRTDTPCKLNATEEDPVDAAAVDETVAAQDTAATIEQSHEEEIVHFVENTINRQEIIELICKDLELREKLNSRNITLQNRLAEHFKRKRTDDSKDNEKGAVDQEQRYYNTMLSLNDLRAESEAVNISNQKGIEEYKLKLEEKIKEVNDKTEQFRKYKRSIALASENSRTGKVLPESEVEQLEMTEKKKEKEVISVRLENIKLRNKLRRHEQLLRQKEELADGLHLIDFEQLKIENQTYNEKIEERNEELLKLRKKITNVVQVLTHVKEKLQFVQTETFDLKRELTNLEEQVAQKRDSLPLLKNARDKLRTNNSLLRQQNGLLGNDKLLLDYGTNVDEAKKIREQITGLQQTYDNLIAESVSIRRKIQKSQLIAQMKTNPEAILNIS